MLLKNYSDRLASFFIFYCYCIVPLFFIVNNVFNIGLGRFWADVFIFIVVLLKIWHMLILGHFKINIRNKGVYSLSSILMCACFVRFLVPLIDISPNWMMAVMEFKPVLYVGSAFIMMLSVSKPLFDIVVRSSMLLSAVLIFDFSIRSFFAGDIHRPISTGEVNYEALLLLISLCVIVSEQKIKKIAFVLVYAGLLVTMSRTALISSLVILFLSHRIPAYIKSLLLLLSVSFVGLSIIIRGLDDAGLDGIDRYWMWVVAIELFVENPLALLTGFNPYLPLPVAAGDIPAQLKWLFEFQMNNKADTGFYPFTFHSMWLRLLSTWGGAAIGLFVFFAYMSFRKKNNFLIKSLSILVILQGLTMGVFYIGYVSVILVIVFLNSNAYGVRKYWLQNDFLEKV